MSFRWIVGLLPISALSALACVGSTDSSDQIVSDVKAASVTLASGASESVSLQVTKAANKVITVDCKPPQNPDEVGPEVTVNSQALGASADTVQAGYYQWAGSLEAGTYPLDIANQGADATCKVSLTAAPQGTCKTWEVRRSPNTHHDHFTVGTNTSADWESFPSSGNHWGAWAAWNSVYAAPVLRGYLLHNLEHGGAVLSYRCNSNESDDCKAKETELVSLANGAHLSRVIVTPDPTQPTDFAIRTWRWSFTSDCLNVKAAKAFLKAHVRHGREDIDSDPPVPFDPTTTDVPCQDLMAAPDSCP